MKQKCSILGEDKNREIEIDIDEKCPACNYGIIPLLKHGFLVLENNRGVVFTILYCPHCKQHFISRYEVQSGGGFKHIYSYPQLPNPEEFSEHILQLSPQFVKIYNQSKQADEIGLDELAGIGYRKSLEFLVKDYLINIQHEDEMEIKKLELGKCIAKITDSKILTLAKGATWLGNDETHYVRKHEDYSIEHLKLFIISVVKMFDSNIAYQKALELIQNPM